jgi:hypothetical protein
MMMTNKSIVQEQNEELISRLEKNNINVPQKEKFIFGRVLGGFILGRIIFLMFFSE